MENRYISALFPSSKIYLFRFLQIQALKNLSSSLVPVESSLGWLLGKKKKTQVVKTSVGGPSLYSLSHLHVC